MTHAEVAAAVWERALEDTLTAEEILRLLLSVAAGKSEIAAGPPVHVGFADLAGAKARVDATMSGSERVGVVLDPSMGGGPP